MTEKASRSRSGRDTLLRLTGMKPAPNQEPNKAKHHEEDQSDENAMPTGMIVPVVVAQTEEVREEACDEIQNCANTWVHPPPPLRAGLRWPQY
jgi:hypothetical protein